MSNYTDLLNPSDNLIALIKEQNAAGAEFGALKGSQPFEVLAAKAIFNAANTGGSLGEVSSVNGHTGVVTLTKSDISLGSVDNTSDATKNAASVTLTNKTLASPVVSGTITGTYTIGGTPTFPATVVTTTGTQTLTNKTLTAPVISTITNTGTVTLPTSTDTLVGRATTDTLTNKTLTAPTLTTPALGTPASGVLTSCTGLPASTGLTGQVPMANGGTGANLVDPNADRILFWDDSAGAMTFLTAGSGLTITGTTITASGGGGGITGPGTSTSTAIARWNGTAGDTLSNSGILIDASDNITGVNDLVLDGDLDLSSATITGGTGTGTVVRATSPTITTPTLSGTATLAEGASIAIDAALSATGTYSGLTQAGTAGTTLAFGDLVYLAAADSRWELTDADAEATAGPVRIGICVLTAAADGDPTVILTYGNVRADSNFPTLSIGAPVYVSTTAGDVQTAQPSGTDDVIRVIGYGNTADELFFCPSNDYITHT